MEFIQNEKTIEEFEEYDMQIEKSKKYERWDAI